MEEGWTEETDGDIILRPLGPEPPHKEHHNNTHSFEPRERKKRSQRSMKDGKTKRGTEDYDPPGLSEMIAGEDRERSGIRDELEAKKLTREEEEKAKKKKRDAERKLTREEKREEKLAEEECKHEGTEDKRLTEESKEAADSGEAANLMVADSRGAKKPRKEETIVEEGRRMEERGREGEGGGIGRVTEHTPGLEVTLKKILTSLTRKRATSGRPEALQVCSITNTLLLFFISGLTQHCAMSHDYQCILC